MAENQDPYGLTSPGGFVFGVAGWNWGEPRPKTITFFLDGTAKVSDQHGRPIEGTMVDGKQVRFASGPPINDEPPAARARLASHAEVVRALAAEQVDWRKLIVAGWPQLPYDKLREAYGPEWSALPQTPLEELRKIRDPALRRDAMRARREADQALAAEMAEGAEE